MSSDAVYQQLQWEPRCLENQNTLMPEVLKDISWCLTRVSSFGNVSQTLPLSQASEVFLPWRGPLSWHLYCLAKSTSSALKYISGHGFLEWKSVPWSSKEKVGQPLPSLPTLLLQVCSGCVFSRSVCVLDEGEHQLPGISALAPAGRDEGWAEPGSGGSSTGCWAGKRQGEGRPGSLLSVFHFPLPVLHSAGECWVYSISVVCLYKHH